MGISDSEIYAAIAISSMIVAGCAVGCSSYLSGIYREIRKIREHLDGSDSGLEKETKADE